MFDDFDRGRGGGLKFFEFRVYRGGRYDLGLGIVQWSERCCLKAPCAHI